MQGENVSTMNIEEKNPLIVVGSGRSGTTWILDVIAEANDLRSVFEPLNPDGIKDALPFVNRYIPKDAEEVELKSFLQKSFSGELNHLWPNTRFLPKNLKPSVFKLITSWDYCRGFMGRYKRFSKRYFSHLRGAGRRPITKCIRANLMLEWITANFDARTIFVVRHPAAVVASKMAASQKKGGAVWDFEGPNEQRILSQYKNDDQLRKDYLAPYSDIFSQKLTPVAGHTLLWCIENILPIYKHQNNKRYVFFYEDLVMHPEEEFKRMVKILNLKKEPEGGIFETRSQQGSVEMGKNRCYTDQLSRWMKSFSGEELAQIEQVLEFFNLAIYTTRDPLPISRVQDTL